MTISETVLILAGRTAVLAILFGIRLAMRAVAGGGAAAPRPGAGLAAGGFVMIAMGIARRFLAAGTNIPPTLPTTALVVDGIYRRTRNPLYLGATLVYLGLAVAAGSLWAIGLVVPLMWVINVGVVAREERYLERKFGDAYRAYKTRVRRWI
jgi:protein-S-isoprenylcysteine O-methyltransferase Ste14